MGEAQLNNLSLPELANYAANSDDPVIKRMASLLDQLVAVKAITKNGCCPSYVDDLHGLPDLLQAATHTSTTSRAIVISEVCNQIDETHTKLEQLFADLDGHIGED